MSFSFWIFIYQTGVVLSLIAAMSFTGPLMTTLSCFSKGGTEIFVPNNLDKEIEDEKPADGDDDSLDDLGI